MIDHEWFLSTDDQEWILETELPITGYVNEKITKDSTLWLTSIEIKEKEVWFAYYTSVDQAKHNVRVKMVQLIHDALLETVD